jgi:hypothetical protein
MVSIQSIPRIEKEAPATAHHHLRLALFDISQPDVSKPLRGEFREFSVERLLRFLGAPQRKPAELRVA